MRLGTRWMVALTATAVVLAGCSDAGGEEASGDGDLAVSDLTIELPPRTAEGLVAPAADELGARDDEATGLRIEPGVETLTVTGAEMSEEVTLVDEEGDALVTLLADDQGQAHFAYIPDEPQTFQTGSGELPTVQGAALAPGIYRVQARGETSEDLRVLGVDEVAGDDFYAKQEIGEGFGYVTMRDGVRLSIDVALPGPIEDGPYPTVVEYSGYSPSKPGDPQPGSMIAGLLGFATVGVNMRGTGCSGGVFDVFNPAQQADGYDAVEAIAAQPWVKNNTVGMVGLSYAGIAQLYVASTRPPHLAAIAPQSVIDDPWREQWPGGLYNDGFTKQWVEERTKQAEAGGQTWDGELIADGDEVCEANQHIRSQNLDFGKFGRALTSFPESASGRFLQLLVPRIEVPTFLTGGYQDEQTGGRFPYLFNKFDADTFHRFKIYNGHHPDGYSPMLISDWYEFLSFYVAGEIPNIADGLRQASAPVFEENFGIEQGFDENRFDDYLPDDFEGAKAAYDAESPVQVLVESGADTDPAGTTGERVRWDFDQFPPADAEATTWYLDADGLLSDSAPTDDGADSFAYEPEAGQVVTTDASSGDFQRAQGDLPITWEQPPEGNLVAYETPELTEDLAIAGPGYLDLWVKPGADDGAVQVDLTEVRPDGSETYVQSGWHELQHAKENAELSDEFQVEFTYTEGDRETLEPDEWIHRRVPIPAVTHIFRTGSRLRVGVQSPGRSRPLWSFESPDIPADTPVTIGRGGDHTTSLVMPTIGGVEIPEGLPACDTLRGQPCRDHLEVANTPAE
ncbi:MAG: CocE/NonD family hydrolase [Microthrixaceae bacterium]